MIITNTERWIKAWAGQGWNTKYLSVPGFIGFVCAGDMSAVDGRGTIWSTPTEPTEATEATEDTQRADRALTKSGPQLTKA